MRVLYPVLFALALSAACGGDEGRTSGDIGASDTEADTSAPEGNDASVEPRDAISSDMQGGDALAEAEVNIEAPPLHTFNLSFEPDAALSSAPFPADFRLNAEGLVALPALGTDPRLAESAKPEILEMLDGAIATRKGFGIGNPVHFFVNSPIVMEGLGERTLIVTLSGPEAGRIVSARVEWAPQTQSLAVSPAWGDYIMAESTYAVLLLEGIASDVDGVITAHPALSQLLGAEPPQETDALRAYTSFEPLRGWLLDEGATVSTDEIIMATVFTTEDVMAYGESVFKLIDAFPLEPPTRSVGWDAETESMIEAPIIEGEALESYFGVPKPPFELNPGGWTSYRRERAAAQTDNGEPYDGGQFQAGIGRVINGSVIVPAPNFAVVDGALKNLPLVFDADGVPLAPLKAMVPFSLFLCEEHLSDPSNLPVAAFTHGGDSHRSAGISWATLNCKLGIATITYDTLYHGGRTIPALSDEGDMVLPANPDESNEYTGLTIEDEGFMPDYAGDPTGGPETVGQLFALPLQLNPNISEGNLIMMAGDTHAITRYLKEGDWSQVVEGLSFNPAMVFHQGLSYGTSFTTPVLALTQDYAAEIWSVGSGGMVASNLLVAPSNAELASGFTRFTLGLKTSADELMAAAWLDPVVGLIQWLSQRGDPLSYAPYVLRHRKDDYALPILASGNSWDETLNTRAQMSFGKAMGFPAYSAGATWTLDPTQPAGESVDAQPYPDAGLSGNVTFGDRTHSAAIFYAQESCHAMQVRPNCTRDHVLEYPPVTKLDTSVVNAPLICELQHQALNFMTSVLSPDQPVEIGAPGGTCEALYGP